VNLIPFNPFPGGGYARSESDVHARFRDVLMQRRIGGNDAKTRG